MTTSNVPRRPSKASMATEEYVRKRKPKNPRVARRKTAVRAAPRAVPTYARNVRIPPRLALQVSDCAMRYMATMCNPFEAEPGACVPCDLFPLPSQKIRAFSRGTFALGTTGFGYIVVNPTSANDPVVANFTTSSSVMTSITAFNAVTNLGTTRLQTLPYSATQIQTAGSVQSRMVSCGLRVRYAGTEAGRGGTVCCYEEQDHNSLATQTYLTIQQAPSAIISRPAGDGSWDGTVCSSGPTSPQELEFSSYIYPNAPVQPSAVDAGYMIIVIAGTAGDSYNFEIFEHIEYIGSAVVAKTPSHADTDQYGKIIQSSKEISAVAPLTPDSGPGFLSRVMNKISESIPQVISAGVGLVRGLSGDATGYAQLLGAASNVVFGPDGKYSSGPRTSLQRQIEAGPSRPRSKL